MKLENKHILILSIFVLILAFGAFKFNSNGIESITGAATVYRDWPGVYSTGNVRCAAEGRRCEDAYNEYGADGDCNYRYYEGSADCSSETYGIGVMWPNIKSTGDKKCLPTGKPCLKAYEAIGTIRGCNVLIFGSGPGYNYYGAAALCADSDLNFGENCLENDQCTSDICTNYVCSKEIECTQDYQCQKTPWSNYCVDGQCIECYNDNECDVGTCQSGFCDECNTLADCDPEEFCWESRRCVECLTSADCDDGIRLTSDYCNEIKVCENRQVVDCLDDTDCPDYNRLMCVGNDLYDIFMDGSCESGGWCDYVDNTESITPCEEGEICYNKECIPEDEEPEPECEYDSDCETLYGSGYECKAGICEEETPPEEEDEDYDFKIGDTGVYCATSTCDDFSGSIDDCDLYGTGCNLECMYQNGVCYLSGGLVESEGSHFDCVTNGYGKCKDSWKTRPPCDCTGDVSVCASADDFYTKEHKVQCTNVEKFPVFDNFNLLVSIILLTMYYLVRKRFSHVRSLFFVS